MPTLDEAYQQAVDAKRIEGAILEGRSRSGQAYSKTFGERTLLDGTKRPLTSNDILFLASATKLLTTIAALQCCERGQLSLDNDLAPSLEGIINLGVLSKYDETSGLPVMEPINKTLTLRHLLTHSSGLGYHFFRPAMARWYDANLAGKPAPDVPSRHTQPLAFQPGEGWEYGPSIDWAGYLVEHTTGLKLDEYFRIHLLGPLDISETEISYFPVKEGLGDRMPDLNPQDPKGEGLCAGNGVNVHGEYCEACFGGQGGYMSATAYVAVLQSLLKDDEKLLSKQSVAEMFKPQLEVGARQSLHQALQGPLGPFFAQGTAGKERDFGLGGLLIGEDGDAGMGRRSLTWAGGVNSAWLLDPTRDVCGFVCPQLGLPPDVEYAIVLKTLFRTEIARALSN
ncbi:beta-lactamase/transpeptidase-like protein [Polychaeton citri CBS 116435]|uniref:Beta-lactamase/transpeptidase-like protein n=1 Tax=Polychaeton citri CBS 116435 TaxID=1314669 RepID=A0A9P4QA80_9PEZI|nr:beta-lactamase/transpeptidase-like protein [Polychaeton citri CBS 116435]